MRISVFAGLLIALCLPSLIRAAELPLREYRKRLQERIVRADASEMVEFLGEIQREVQRAKRLDLIPLVFEALVAMQDKDVVARGLQILNAVGAEALAPIGDLRLGNDRIAAMERVVWMLVAASFDGAKSEDWLINGLDSEHVIVQRHAIEGLEARRSKRAIPILIGILEKDGVDRSTRAYEARMALISLTGHDYDVAEDWRKLWEGHKDSLDPSNLRRNDGGRTGVTVLKDPPEFFGVNLVSKRVVFVVDVSESMRKFDHDAVTEDDDEGWEKKQRLYRLKWHFAKTVHKLPSDAMFTVLVFGSTVDSLSKKLVPASRSWKRKARDLIYRQKGGGDTNTKAALRVAFDYQGVDTILFLSDGAPQALGRTSDQLIPEIEDMVQDLNSLRRVRVFTFGFEGVGEWPPGSKQRSRGPMPGALDFLGFMRRLAVRNGGTYTPIQ
ncbi:MAG: VWA domain-containing protein [Planctomycetota bacterium]